jgi:hypothetical protein
VLEELLVVLELVIADEVRGLVEEDAVDAFVERFGSALLHVLDVGFPPLRFDVRVDGGTGRLHQRQHLRAHVLLALELSRKEVAHEDRHARFRDAPRRFVRRALAAVVSQP